MHPKINPAYRVNQVVEKVRSKKPHLSKLDVWSEAFGISSDRTSLKSIQVSKSLSYLHDELDTIRNELPKLGIPDTLYRTAIDRLEEAFSAMNLSTSWEDSKRFLDDGTITSLSYWAAMLPDEENLISEESLNEICNLVDELEKILGDAELPPSLIRTINNLITLFREALDKYPLQGARALKAAAVSAYGELSIVKDELKEPDSKVIKALAKLWSVFTKTVDGAEKVDSALSIGQRTVMLLEKLPNFFS